MKKWTGGVLIGSMFMLLVLRYGLMKNPFGESLLQVAIIFNATDPQNQIQSSVPPEAQDPKADNDQVVPAETFVSSLFCKGNFSSKLNSSLLTWNRMKHLINYTQGLPNALEAVREAQVAWESLVKSLVEQQRAEANESALTKVKEKQCPYFLNKMNDAEFGDSGYQLRVPCGLIQGSAITIIGIPNGLMGNFRIDLTGEQTSGEPDPPIVLHYNVRLQGDKITEDPVIVQNTWTAAHDWGEEERCPSLEQGSNKKVDDLKRCSDKVGKDGGLKFRTDESSQIHLWSSRTQNRSGNKWFPFKQGHLSVMTLRVGEEGFQMTVDGKHITSFAYREGLEPWLVNKVMISGDIKLISVLASGLPTSEDLEHIVDLDLLRSAPIPPNQPLDLFVGVFSTANNFKRRMAVRRTWMQYSSVKEGPTAVRFFVGLHKNQIVNEELWSEVETYGDIQLMPFVDYYSVITWKTVGICIFGTEVVSAKYVMKTDDDAFVRVDEVLASINRANVTNGLLYGLINSDARPHRNRDSKWYISPEEWPEPAYPPWAHGPGYVLSHDIAKAVYTRHKEGRLRMFKLEDVAMGIWIAEMKKEGLQVSYKNEQRIYNEGCKDGYVVAHYQSPRQMLCLWQKLQEEKVAQCCADR
ncbi:hypothetical protein SLA2020_295340 [Shorea laevis]